MVDLLCPECGAEQWLDVTDDEDDPGIWRCEACPWSELDDPLPTEAERTGTDG